VLVTGSTTGIGESIARRFALEGASVMVHGRRQPEAQKVVADIEAAGGQAAFHLGGLHDPAFCAELIEATVARFGRIDILVNNAALTDRSTLETTDAAFFDRIMAVNARAPLLLVQAALPHFRKARHGVVLNIGSVNAYCGEPVLLAYSMSKGALMTLSRNLADSLATEHIRVNHFNVGWVLTPNEYAQKIKDGLPADWPDKLPLDAAPSGRLLAPEDIAQFAVAFVEDGGPITGAVVELEQHSVIGHNPPKSVDENA
jgi:NAD(P)-dependent dehydrogenase (short-subunit alcohol dehydrogenase family)